VYQANHPDTLIKNRNIQAVPIRQLEKLAADLWLMSPPCQPYSRQGHQRGLEDARSDSFRYLLDALTQMKNPPSVILVENVVGFESSQGREELVATLNTLQYRFQEFWLSPDQFGVPNSRLRYFLLAIRGDRFRAEPSATAADAAFGNSSTLMYHLPGALQFEPGLPTSEFGTFDDAYRVAVEQSQVSDYSYPQQVCIAEACAIGSKKKKNNAGCLTSHPPRMGILSSTHLARHLPGSGRLLLRWGRLLDIVRPEERRSLCFTKGYSHKVEGTGSVFQVCICVAIPMAFEQLDVPSPGAGWPAVEALELRYFTPQEMLRLHGFPTDFVIPSSVTDRQARKAIGNSLCVTIVAHLLDL
ncbi:uncharacterized protein MONBRDRAFT_1464, partial [Monosiga brevicollis MX1]